MNNYLYRYITVFITFPKWVDIIEMRASFNPFLLTIRIIVTHIAYWTIIRTSRTIIIIYHSYVIIS